MTQQTPEEPEQVPPLEDPTFGNGNVPGTTEGGELNHAEESIPLQELVDEEGES